MHTRRLRIAFLSLQILCMLQSSDSVHASIHRFCACFNLLMLQSTDAAVYCFCACFSALLLCMQEAGHSLGAGGPLTKFKRQMSLTTKGCITPSGMEEQLRSVPIMLPLQLCS